MDEPKFLYIEDHAGNRRVMKLLLTDVLGYSNLTMLEHSENLIQNLEALNTAIDVIFLDLNLKPIDGYGVHELLREHTVFRHARIVAVTASATPADIRKMQEAGFDGVIAKPLSYDTFPDQLRMILAGQPVWETM